MHFTYPKISDGDFRLRIYEKTERITYAFNMRAPGGRYYKYFWRVNAPCSRTQHGLTRVGLEPPTSGSGVRGINHHATALSKEAILKRTVICNTHM